MAATPKTKDTDAGARERLMEATVRSCATRATLRRPAPSGRIAPESARAGVTLLLPTMDDLFLAVLRSGSEASLARMRWWAITGRRTTSGVVEDQHRLANGAACTPSSWHWPNHRKAIGAELKTYAEARAGYRNRRRHRGAACPRHRSEEFRRWRSRCWSHRSRAAYATRARSA